MPTLQDLEGPLDAKITTLLIEATPDTWKAATLVVERREYEGGYLGLAHTITSPEGHRDIVSVTEELSDATYELAQLFEKHGRAWRKVVYEIREVPGGQWDYRVDFTY